MKITEIIELLQTNEFLGVSQEVEIAKGKNARVRSLKHFFNQIKRYRYARKNNI